MPGSCCTADVNDCCVPAGMRADDGATETVIALTVTADEAERPAGTMEVAVSVAVRSLTGGLAGAL